MGEVYLEKDDLNQTAHESEYSERQEQDQFEDFYPTQTPEQTDESQYTTRSSKPPADEKLEELTRMLAVQMAPNKIKEADRSGDKIALRDALVKFEQIGEDDMEKYVQTSPVDPWLIASRAVQKLKHIQDYEEALQKACDNKHIKTLQELIKTVSENDIQRFLRPELAAARDCLAVLTERKLKLPILAMDKKTMTELKHYSNPSPLVHRVMQAALLLLGVDEGKTAAWIQCQTLCTPDGPNGLNRKLMQFDASKVHPFIADRVRIMISDIELQQIQRASPGGATFYVWVKGILNQMDEEKSEKEDNSTEEQTDDTELTDTDREVLMYDPQLSEKTMQGKTVKSLAKIIEEERKIFSKHTMPKKPAPKPRHSQYVFHQV